MQKREKTSKLSTRKKGLKNPNHPKKGSTLKIEPIRKMKDIRAIMKILSDHPRNYCLFVLGINWGLRASDLIRITAGQVRYIEDGESFELKEKKTGKLRRLTMNEVTYKAIHKLFKSRSYVEDEPLFQGQRGVLTVPYINALVKKWTSEINLKGRYGSHTLRKTFGYVKRVDQKVDIPTLMEIFGHSTQKQTLSYLCIQREEVRDVYLNGIG